MGKMPHFLNRDNKINQTIIPSFKGPVSGPGMLVGWGREAGHCLVCHHSAASHSWGAEPGMETPAQITQSPGKFNNVIHLELIYCYTVVKMLISNFN